MLQRLLETRATPDRGTGSTVASVAIHAVVIALAVALTVRAEDGPQDCTESPRQPGCPVLPPLVYVEPTIMTPDGRGRSGSGRTHSGTLPPSLPLLPDVAGPDIDVPSIPTSGLSDGRDARDQLGVLAGTSGEPASGAITSERSVDVPIRELESPTPRYPAALRARGVSGVVLAEFVVDSTGRVDPASVRVLDSPDPLFGEAVRASLRGARFTPGTVRGRPVRTLARRAYRFELH